MQRVFYTDPFIPNSHLDVENGTKSGHGKLSKTPTSVSEGARSETRSRVASLPIWREFHRQSFSSNQPQSLEPAESLRDDVHSSTSSPVPSSVFEDPSSHTLVRAVSQQFRSQWAGALSRRQLLAFSGSPLANRTCTEYSVTLDTPRTSSLLRPLKRREREMSMAGN